MCRPTDSAATTATTNATASSPSNVDIPAKPRSFWHSTSSMVSPPKSLYPLPLWLVMSCFFIIFPPSCCLDGGYTRWWIRLCVVFVLTQHKPLAAMLLTMGLSINASWYSVCWYDLLVLKNPFGNILFRNARVIRTVYLDENQMRENELELWQTPVAKFARVSVIVLDVCLHVGPVLYLYWYCCCRPASSSQTNNNTASTNSNRVSRTRRSLAEVITWPAWMAAYALIRFWNILHCWNQYKQFSTFYYGLDIYVMPPRGMVELWNCGHTMETGVFVVIAIYKLWWMYANHGNKSAAAQAQSNGESKSNGKQE